MNLVKLVQFGAELTPVQVTIENLSYPYEIHYPPDRQHLVAVYRRQLLQNLQGNALKSSSDVYNLISYSLKSDGAVASASKPTSMVKAKN